MAHQAAQLKYEAEPFNLIQIFPLLQPAPVTFHPAFPHPPRQCAQLCVSHKI